MVEPYKKILTEPKMFSYSKYKTTSYASEFKLFDFKDNWYQINVPSVGQGWVNGKNILKIVQRKDNARETSPTGKAALYRRFADLYPDSRFSQKAKDKADDIYYGLAKEGGSINSYSMYLRMCPDGKHAKAARSKLDTLTFQDESFRNSIDRLKHWITNNPESTFMEKARKRIDELTFAQAKYDNNTVSLEGYIIDFPDGKFVSEAKQLIEDIKYNHAKFKDTINSYRKYLDEYPDGRYADDAAKRIDEKEFSVLLNSKDIETLAEHLKKEENKERLKLVKNRIEELYFKMADGADNDAEAIKIYEEYLQKYPEGLYVQEARIKIEERFFILAVKTNTKDAYRDFIKRYPQSKYNQESVDSIEVLDFNVALGEDTIESLERFLITYPNGDFSQLAKSRIEELASKEAKDADTIEAYEDVVKEYPDSHLAITAKNIIETGYFENASKKGTVEAYREYVELYPDGSHLEKVLLIIDMLTFKPYDEKGSVRSLKKFIKKYPDNRFVEDAKIRIDQLNYEYYQKKDTLRAYKKFVRKYPNNRYVNKARQKIAKLTLIGESKSDKSSFWFWLIIIGAFSIGLLTAFFVLKNKDTAKEIQYPREKIVKLKRKEEPVPSGSYTNTEFKNKYDRVNVKNINYESQTIGKTRNAGTVIILSIITFSVYYVIWYYKINKEIKVHDPDQKFSPGWATVALFCPFVCFVSVYNTADRIRKMQKADGLQDLISPGAALAWYLLFLIGYFVVVQGALNNHWYDHSKMESSNR